MTSKMPSQHQPMIKLLLFTNLSIIALGRFWAKRYENLKLWIEYHRPTFQAKNTPFFQDILSILIKWNMIFWL